MIAKKSLMISSSWRWHFEYTSECIILIDAIKILQSFQTGCSWLVLVDVVCSSLCNCLRCVYTVYTLYVKALIFLSCIWMASQSHCPVAGVRSVHGCNATPFLQAFGADPVQAPAQGTIDFPAQAGRPAPDKKKADGNAVSLSAPSLSCSDSHCISVRMITCEAIHFFICIYCKDVVSEF